jgi:hypothetical protein
MLENDLKHLAIATDTIVVVIASPFRAQDPILLLEWRMAMLTTPCPYPLHTPAQAFSDRLALDDQQFPDSIQAFEFKRVVI